VRRRTLLAGLCVGAWGVESSAWPGAIQGIPAIEAGGQVDLRIGFARPGGGYTIQTLPLETYIARVLAGEAARIPGTIRGGVPDGRLAGAQRASAHVPRQEQSERALGAGGERERNEEATPR